MRRSYGEVSYHGGQSTGLGTAFLLKPVSDLPDDQGHVLFLGKNITEPEKAL